MSICPRLLFAVGICVMAVPTAAESLDASGSALAPTTGRESGWQFSVSPYLWMSGLKGDMGVIEEVAPVGVDLSFFDILDAMKFSLMGGFEARNGRFVGTTDMVYLKMGASENIEIRETDFLDVELGTTTFIATATAGYRAVDRDGLFVDARRADTDARPNAGEAIVPGGKDAPDRTSPGRHRPRIFYWRHRQLLDDRTHLELLVTPSYGAVGAAGFW